MTIENPALRCLAEDCVRTALARWRKKRVWVVNHTVWLDGQEMEWLSIVTAKGAVRIIQHFPTGQRIGVFSAGEVRALAARRAPGITTRAIRGHVRHETRRRA
jgi:hypothetical protein